MEGKNNTPVVSTMEDVIDDRVVTTPPTTPTSTPTSTGSIDTSSLFGSSSSESESPTPLQPTHRSDDETSSETESEPTPHQHHISPSSEPTPPLYEIYRLPYDPRRPSWMSDQSPPRKRVKRTLFPIPLPYYETRFLNLKWIDIKEKKELGYI